MKSFYPENINHYRNCVSVDLFNKYEIYLANRCNHVGNSQLSEATNLMGIGTSMLVKGTNLIYIQYNPFLKFVLFLRGKLGKFNRIYRASRSLSKIYYRKSEQLKILAYNNYKQANLLYHNNNSYKS